MTRRTSVIMPVRNGARFIREGIESALAQLAYNDEIVVVDDASTDATRAIVATINDPRLRVLDGAGRGVSSARNIGLSASVGEFIAFLDHDDLWPPQRHAVLLRALTGVPAFDWAAGGLRLKVERDAIALSVQEFQLGESSEGRHLISAASRYAAYSGDFDYVTALRLFIAEENRQLVSENLAGSDVVAVAESAR